VEAALEKTKLIDLPRTPDGRHVAADLMAFYFRSSDGNDLCYRAAIGRDQCRGLKGSDNPPAMLAQWDRPSSCVVCQPALAGQASLSAALTDDKKRSSVPLERSSVPLEQSSVPLDGEPK
jgi:hypothetical protein